LGDLPRKSHKIQAACSSRALPCAGIEVRTDPDLVNDLRCRRDSRRKIARELDDDTVRRIAATGFKTSILPAGSKDVDLFSDSLMRSKQDRAREG
jgi:hypothetical protein